ncbi:MAG: hypothetical protein DESF_01139 [Desulfovibrio sp.]
MDDPANTRAAISEDVALANEVIGHVHAILTGVSVSEAPLPEKLCQLEGMENLHNLIWGIRSLAHNLGKGDLHYMSRQRGFVIGSLKALQSDLRHLTWQAQCIAKGEYQHRINFLGDFSTAFNKMVEELDKNVSELTRLSLKYKQLSFIDPLTGLLNRRAFMAKAEKTLELIRDKGLPASILLADIDHFKAVNDTYGHACGDEVLVRFSRCISSFLREQDLCCRYGGEEFVILLPAEELDEACRLGEKIRLAVEQTVMDEAAMLHCTQGRTRDGQPPSPHAAVPLRITVSLGVSRLCRDEAACSPLQELETGIAEADRCLYRAKHNGRNAVVCQDALSLFQE